MSLFTVPAFASETDDNPYNVALDKTVTDVNNTGNGTFTTDKLTNGDSTDSSAVFMVTSTKRANAVYEIDLAGTYTISGVDVMSGNNNNGAPASNDVLKAYQIHYLSNGEWIPAKIAAGTDVGWINNAFMNNRVTVLADGCTVNCVSGNNFLVFDGNITTNKIRLVSKDETVAVTKLREIRVYKADDNNVAFRKPVSINYSDFGGGSGKDTLRQVPSYAVDGQSDNASGQEYALPSKANTASNDYYVEIDLLKDYNINRAQVVTKYSAASIKLQAYVNNAWVDIPDAAVTNNKAANCEFTFPVYTANKVRVFFPAGNSSLSIREVKLYAVDDIVVNEFGYTNNGEPMQGLVDDATFNGSMTLTNNTNSTKNVTFISALYENVNGSLQLKNAKTDTAQIAGGGQSETLEVNIELPENTDNYVLKTFLFDTMDNIKPYFASGKFRTLTKDVLKAEFDGIEDNQYMPDTATVEVQATYGTKNVKDVELYLDDTELATTYSDGVYSAKLPDGITASTHTLYAKAIGEDDTEVTTDTFNVNVYDSSKIVVKQTNNNITFYIKGSDENSNRYIKHIFKRATVPANNEGKDLGGDLWRMYGSYDVERTGEYDFTDVYNDTFVAYGTEWECALEIADKDTYIPNKSDSFIGGYHKNEFVIDDSIAAKYDGVAVDLTKSQNLLVDKIEFAEKSNMYIGAQTEDELLAVHTKDYEITATGGIKVVQGFEFKKSVGLKSAYTTMLPIMRQLNDGTQITDRAMRDDNGNGLFDDTEYDVTYGKNSTIEIGKAANGIYAAKIWGVESGISAEVTVSYDPVIETNDFFVAMYTENNGYNKLYYDYCGSYTPQVGEKWNVTTTFKFDITK
ncbi:MAG: hypothetical protein J6D26_07415 [Clostridia bacterium]|nr:hypothetical protein [Clostridia bacterium]